MTVIDAHQHFWDLTQLDYPWLRHPAFTTIDRSFTPETLEPQLDEVGVDKTVVVQAADAVSDTDYLLNIADGWGRVAGVVGWVPLLDPDAAEAEIERRAVHPAFVGVRHLIHDEADIDWVVQDPVLESLRRLGRYGLTFDIVAVLPRHLEHVATVADAAPGLASSSITSPNRRSRPAAGTHGQRCWPRRRRDRMSTRRSPDSRRPRTQMTGAARDCNPTSNERSNSSVPTD